VIQSSGMGARHLIRNKQWYEARFQSVVDALIGEVEFIRVGSATDPVLQNANDRPGTTGIRETAAILHHARLYVGTVGFLMHLARAVECPCVIIYGGREAPWQSGYICNFNLYTPLPCAPYWRWNGCECDRQCMREIGVADVVSAIRQMMERPRGPLEVAWTQSRAMCLPESPSI
jgi:ADP-heptose:LPS heptosyltransferase